MIREGWIDYVVPQLYWPRVAAADCAVLAPWWAEWRDGSGLWPGRLPGGEDGWKVRTPSQNSSTSTRSTRITGDIYFSMKDLNDRARHREGLPTTMRACTAPVASGVRQPAPVRDLVADTGEDG